jgi:hypothetical protein
MSDNTSLTLRTQLRLMLTCIVLSLAFLGQLDLDLLARRQCSTRF